jgi:predicted PurR-regulated permease PerM
MRKKHTKVKTNVSHTGEKSSETASKNIAQASSQQLHQLNYGHYFLFFLLFLSIFTSYRLIQPYLNPIILATLLAILVKPIYAWFVHFCRGRKSLAAFLTSTLLTLVVLIPLIFLIFSLIQQGIQSFNAIYDWVASGEYKTLLENPWILKIRTYAREYLPNVQKFFPNFNLETLKLSEILLQVSSNVGKNLVNQGGQLFGNITVLVGQFFLMLFAFFFIVRDQDQMFEAMLHLIPLSASQEDQILEKIQSVAKSALLGTLVTAIAQGVAGGIAFHIAHLPGLFWGTMMAFASLIPVVGTALIWVPAAIYLLLSGHWGYSIFIVLWSAIIVGSIDNFVRPLFMKGSGQNISTLLIFFSILGGINYFGLIGLLYGPLILGLTMVLLYIYSIEFESFLNQQDKS